MTRRRKKDKDPWGKSEESSNLNDFEPMEFYTINDNVEDDRVMEMKYL